MPAAANRAALPQAMGNLSYGAPSSGATPGKVVGVEKYEVARDVGVHDTGTR